MSLQQRACLSIMLLALATMIVAGKEAVSSLLLFFPILCLAMIGFVMEDEE